MGTGEVGRLRMDCVLRMVKVFADFQNLEKHLKDHISKKYELIKVIIDGRVTFNFSPKKLNKQTLGTLVDELAKVSDNNTFINNLREIIPERNDIAHTSFALINASNDVTYLNNTYLRLSSIEYQVEQIMEYFFTEVINTVLVHASAIDNKRQ
jgi:hypothetical protein